MLSLIMSKRGGQGSGCCGALAAGLYFSEGPWFSLFIEQVNKSSLVSGAIISLLWARQSEIRVVWKVTCPVFGNLEARGVLWPPEGRKLAPTLWEVELGCTFS